MPDRTALTLLMALKLPWTLGRIYKDLLLEVVMFSAAKGSLFKTIYVSLSGAFRSINRSCQLSGFAAFACVGSE